MDAACQHVGEEVTKREIVREWRKVQLCMIVAAIMLSWVAFA